MKRSAVRVNSSGTAQDERVSYRRVDDLAVEPLPNARTGAACRDEDPELFFPFEGEKDKEAAAKAVCAGCELLSACREFAVEHPNLTEFGVWGGTTERERRLARRRFARMAAKAREKQSQAAAVELVADYEAVQAEGVA